MSESTSILDLPTDPLGGGNISNGITSNGITLSATENTQFTNQTAPSLSLDQTTINQIVNGIQQASVNGSTKLPSRDIPMTTTGFSNDPYIRPNYVPPPPTTNKDYIQNHEETSDMVNKYNKNLEYSNSLDNMYNQIQTPLLITILYFLFQLPFFRNLLFKYLPFLFSTDGNYNMNGYLFTSILFGLLFYTFNKLSNYFNVF
jgi:hypothetical protein